MLGRRDKAKGLEAEVQGLETRLAGVQSRLGEATARHEATVAEQRRFLVETDGADARQAKAVAEACRRTADDRAALEDAARTLAAQIGDAKNRLAAERDRRERDRAAGEIEAGAELIEAAAARLDEAAAAFDAAREAVVSACRDHAPKDILGADCRHGIVTAAGRQAGILSREPDVSAMFGPFHVEAVPAAAGPVAAMRDNAKAIRTGAAPNVRPEPPPEWPRSAVFPEVVTVLSGPAFYRTHLGQRIDLPQPGGFAVPEPIASRAIELGVGFPQSSREGQDIARILSAQPAARLERTAAGFRAVKHTGIMGDKGEGIPPAPEPVDLGGLPDFYGVVLPMAAQ